MHLHVSQNVKVSSLCSFFLLDISNKTIQEMRGLKVAI